MVKDPVPLSEVRRALVIKLRHHGDVLLTSPVFSTLKEKAPHIHIDALVFKDTADMLSLHPALSQLHGIDRKWSTLGPFAQFKEEWQLFKTLKARRYDLIIHLTDHPRGAWLTRLTGARWSVAPQKPERGKWWKKSFTHLYATPRNGKRHTVELHLDALRRLGVFPTATSKPTTLIAGATAEKNIRQVLALHSLESKAFIHLHPASRWTFKCWPVAQMAALIDELQTRGWPVVLTAAPSPDEHAMVEQILHAAKTKPVSLAGQLSLKDMAALTSQASLFIGVDSAPMHIAAAVGTPTVALFGPSGEFDWGPWQVPAKVITSTEHHCRPCGRDGCGGSKRSDCLEKIGVETVLEAALDLLAEIAQP